MNELEPRKVVPEYSVDFYDPSEYYARLRKKDFPPDNYHSISFKEIGSGKPRIALVVSADRRLVSEVAEFVRFENRPQTEEEVRDEIGKHSTRYPMASNYTGKIVCEEPSCKFYMSGGCTNSNVVIEDSCGANTYCLTYDPKEA